MKKGLKYGIEFLTVTGVFFILISLSTVYLPGLKSDKLLIGTQPTYWGSNMQRVPDMEKWIQTNDGKPKLLILGSSTAYRGINPAVLNEKLGVSCFNAASSSQRIKLSIYLLKRLVKQTKIDYVLLDIYPHFWGNYSNEPALDWIVNNPDLYRYSDILGEYPARKVIVNYAYYSIKRGVLPLFGLTEKISGDKAHNGAYMGNGFVCSPDDKPQYIDKSPKKFNNEEKFKNDLAELKQLCAQHHIKLVLLIPPIIGYADNPRFELPLINANQPGLDTAYFYDDHHLYCKGTTPYTELVVAELEMLIKQ